jgi:hypothetical protein
MGVSNSCQWVLGFLAQTLKLYNGQPQALAGGTKEAGASGAPHLHDELRAQLGRGQLQLLAVCCRGLHGGFDLLVAAARGERGQSFWREKKGGKSPENKQKN